MMTTKRIFALAGLSLLALSAGTAASSANVTYTYSGNNFAFPAGGYDTNDSINGYLEFADYLPANQSFSGLLSSALDFSFSFSFGGDTIDKSNYVQSVSAADVSTSASGDILSWHVQMQGLFSGKSFAIMEITNGVPRNYNNAPEYVTSGTCVTVTEYGCSNGVFFTGEAYNYSPGTWSVSSTVSTVPLPAGLPLYAGGMALLGAFGLRRRRAGSTLAS